MVHSFSHHDGTLAGEIKMIELECWKTCPDIKTLFRMNQQYLAGDLLIHPAIGHTYEDECTLVTRSLREMNEYGMFTFLNQRQKVLPPIDPHEHNEPHPDPSSKTDAWCRCCMNGHCFAEPTLCSQMRALPFVQFCIPLESEGCVSRQQVLHFIESLLKDNRLHTMISWPRNLPVTLDFARCTVASTMLAKTYIPQQDLEEYFHYRSRLGNARTHEIRQGFSKRDLGWREYEPVQWKWSEVCDFHLLRPRVPEWFLGKDSKTVVVGVNCVQYGFWGDMESLPALIMSKAKEAGFTKVFPVTHDIAEGGKYNAQRRSPVNFEHEILDEEEEGSPKENEALRQSKDTAIRDFGWLEL